MRLPIDGFACGALAPVCSLLKLCSVSDKLSLDQPSPSGDSRSSNVGLPAATDDARNEGLKRTGGDPSLRTYWLAWSLRVEAASCDAGLALGAGG
jgi:hypothetical protein